MLVSTPMSSNDDDMSINQAAEHAGVSRQSLYDWFQQGLPFHTVPNEFGVGTRRVVRSSEMDAWIAEQRKARGAK